MCKWDDETTRNLENLAPYKTGVDIDLTKKYTSVLKKLFSICLVINVCLERHKKSLTKY